jgi:hypothetical protein
MASIYAQGIRKDALVICYFFNQVKFRISPGLKNTLAGQEKARDIVEKIELDIELGIHPATEKKLVQARKQAKPKRVKQVKVREVKASSLWIKYQEYREAQFTSGKISRKTLTLFEGAAYKLLTFPFNSEWADQERWLNKLSNNNKYYLLGILSSFQIYCNKLNGGTVNRFSLERSTIKHEKVRERTAVKEEWLVNLRNSPELNRRYLTFLFYSGCRPREALAIKWGDIKDGRILIHRSTRETEKTKTKRNRYVPLAESSPFGSFLQEAIGEKGETDDYIFNLNYDTISRYISDLSDGQFTL